MTLPWGTKKWSNNDTGVEVGALVGDPAGASAREDLQALQRYGDAAKPPIHGIYATGEKIPFIKGQSHGRYHDFWPKFTEFN